MNRFVGHEFIEEIFHDVTLSHVSFEQKIFNSCVFKKCSFLNSSWDGALFDDSVFQECTLSLTTLGKAQFRNTLFRQCNLIGLDFSICDVLLGFSVTIEKSVVKHCNFSGLDMKKARLTDNQMHACYFNGTNLKQALFTNSDLQGSVFHNTHLQEASFVHAKNYIISPLVNRIEKAIFSFPDCIGILKGLDIIIEKYQV